MQDHINGIFDRLGGIEAHLGNVRDSLEEIKHTLEGNGVPGLKTRVDRLEQQQAVRSKWFWGLHAATLTGLASLLKTKLFGG